MIPRGQALRFAALRAPNQEYPLQKNRSKNKDQQSGEPVSVGGRVIKIYARHARSISSINLSYSNNIQIT